MKSSKTVKRNTNRHGQAKTRRETLRPTTSRVRSAIFSILGPNGPEGSRVLDIYAGTGALGIEALQRGARYAVFIDHSSKQCETIKKSLVKHKLSVKSVIHRGSALNLVGKLKGQYDLFFVDPPYDLDEFEPLFFKVDQTQLIATGAIAFIEHSKRTVLPDRLPGFALSTHRVYGDSAVSVYKADVTETNGDIR